MLDWSWLVKLALLCVRCMYGCGNCFGRFTKSQRLDPENLSTKDSRGAAEGETVPLNKPLENSSSSNEMENNGSSSRQQRGSTTSSVNANHHVPEIQAPADNNDANAPFVNHALRVWTQRRREWVGNRERTRPAQHREPVISWSTTYEDLLGTSRPFTQPISLPEMVDFLVDVWEQEGLY
jgi:hypothetical protein